MFSRDQRIIKKDDFQKIYKEGYIYNFDSFRVFILKNDFKKSRASVIVSKKVSPLATKRNQIKRKLRYAIKSLMQNSPNNIDILIVVNNINITKLKTPRIRDYFSNVIIFKKNI